MSAPETHLEAARVLYAERDLLKRALDEVDAKIAAERKSYSFATGCCVPIREESFRREVISHG